LEEEVIREENLKKTGKKFLYGMTGKRTHEEELHFRIGCDSTESDHR
jgi:hypothetical protein